MNREATWRATSTSRPDLAVDSQSRLPLSTRPRRRQVELRNPRSHVPSSLSGVSASVSQLPLLRSLLFIIVRSSAMIGRTASSKKLQVRPHDRERPRCRCVVVVVEARASTRSHRRHRRRHDSRADVHAKPVSRLTNRRLTFSIAVG